MDTVKFICTDDHATAPAKAHEDDAAYDLFACIPRLTCDYCDGTGGVENPDDQTHGATIIDPCDNCNADGIIDTGERYLEPGGSCLINTGIALELPLGYAALVLPRSGLALKEGITVLNAPGLIDAGYRGDVGVIVHSAARQTPYTIRNGDRIAQLLIVKLADVFLTRAAWLSHSERADGGFGSSGR